MPINRRSFVLQSASLAGVTLLGGVAFPSGAVEQTFAENNLLSQMKWMNDPASWKNEGGKTIVRSKPKTDFWRKTYYGYITDNGHFFHLSVNGDFSFEARIS